MLVDVNGILKPTSVFLVGLTRSARHQEDATGVPTLNRDAIGDVPRLHRGNMLRQSIFRVPNRLEMCNLKKRIGFPVMSQQSECLSSQTAPLSPL